MDTILIVENEELEQEFLKSLAKENLSSDYQIFTCDSGIDAVKLAKVHKPSLIFMDIMLYEMDGLTAIREIRNFLPDTCITILSACSDFSYAQEAISLQVFEYLLKPIRPSKFKEVLKDMVDSKDNCKLIAQKSFSKETLDNEHCQKHFINESVKYINENFKGKLTLDEVSSKAFMNPKYFSKVFKQETGISFSNYVNDLKIKYACTLLETTNYPAYRISMECGFSDPSYFNRVFTGNMNMTPLNYKKNILSKNEKK